MENYGRCKDCKWVEPPKSGWKWSCEYYHTLEDPDEIRDCPHYERRGSGSSGCFLTTACCVYKGLPDDCYELQAMRRLRDEYIKKQSYGEQLISDYYSEAPIIVKMINESSDRDEILERTYNKIVDIVEIIDSGNYESAVILYLLLLHELSRSTIIDEI